MLKEAKPLHAEIFRYAQEDTRTYGVTRFIK